MANRGEYVRSRENGIDQPSDNDPETAVSSCDSNGDMSHDDGSEYSAEYNDGHAGEEGGSEVSDSACNTTHNTDATSSDEEPPTKVNDECNASNEDNITEQVKKANSKEESNTSERMRQIEKVLADLSKAITLLQTPLTSSRTPPLANPETDQSWNFCHEPTRSQTSYTTVRPEHIKPFPSGIRPNKMWAEWFDFIENFEVAVSLHNTNDPVYKVKLLYLSLGQELQAIVKAVNLRPSLNSPDCYTTFVKNIETHLSSMTDTVAEHQAFQKMKQGVDESTVAFHARLIRNVKLCSYSDSDRSRFVRTQLLEGLRNKDLVRAARTYGYETNFIVQSATRDEAYNAETIETDILQVDQGYGGGRKRTSTSQESSYPPAKYRRTNPDSEHTPDHRSNQSKWTESFSLQAKGNQANNRIHGRRSRCPRCNNVFHRNPQCPALSRTCNKCGKRGHFATVCRTGQVIQQVATHGEIEYSEENHFGQNKVKQN